MSAKTKIIVLHMKELIYTGIFIILGILFIILLAMMFLPEKDSSADPAEDRPDTTLSTDEAEDKNAVVTSANDIYIPGIYTTQLVLNDQTIEIEVIVDNKSITSLRLVNLNEAVTTMYPLLEPTFHSLSEQIYKNQSVDNITYDTESKYTSLVLLEAVRNALDKARAGSVQ